MAEFFVLVWAFAVILGVLASAAITVGIVALIWLGIRYLIKGE